VDAAMKTKMGFNILTYKDKIEAGFYYIIVLQRFPMKMISIVF